MVRTMTIEQAIDDLTDASRSIAEVAESESDEANRINAQNVADDCKQLAAWLRELQERRKADSETERGSARWLINSDGYYPYCSACMKEPKDGKMTDVCPSCGARMDGKIT